MDVMTAIKQRRSCRSFSSQPVAEDDLEQILEAATWAPSPLNSQPWEFIVVTRAEIKEKIYVEAVRCRNWAIEKSGWKWLAKYRLEFLKIAPVIVAVIGDPKKTGMDAFQEEGGVGYQHACAAAIQNMHLAAYALGLGSLWFTLFDKKPMRGILNVDDEKVPLGLVCLGKSEERPSRITRKDVQTKTAFLH